MGNIYKFLGLTVGCVSSETDHNAIEQMNMTVILYMQQTMKLVLIILRDNLKNDFDKFCFKKRCFCNC